VSSITTRGAKRSSSTNLVAIWLTLAARNIPVVFRTTYVSLLRAGPSRPAKSRPVLHHYYLATANREESFLKIDLPPGETSDLRVTYTCVEGQFQSTARFSFAMRSSSCRFNALFDAFRYWHEWWENRGEQNDESRRLEQAFVEATTRPKNWTPADADLATIRDLCLTAGCKSQVPQHQN
jgi:hypothetical protein